MNPNTNPRAALLWWIAGTLAAVGLAWILTLAGA